MANPDNTPTPDTLQEALLNDPEFLQRLCPICSVNSEAT